MTEKLYYRDSHIKVFRAVVISCEKSGEGYRVVLDRTAFFPEGGGQPADTGKIGGVNVMDVREDGDTVVHYTCGPLDVGSEIECAIDWDKRFRRMQNHTGEHIVSGIVHRLYGFNNVGFHMGSGAVTIDFDGELTSEDLYKIETLANEAVYKNVPVSATYPKPAYLKRLKYRSKLDITEGVRLVWIPGYDLCACCAPHVKRTGEIGGIKLLDFMRHRGGVRVNMLAGYDALCDIRLKYENIAAISAALSAQQDKTAEAVLRMKRELITAKQEILSLKRELLAQRISAVEPTGGNICIFETGIDTLMMREMVNDGVKLCGGICAVFCGSDKDGYSYIMSSERIDMREKAREINRILSGRGGGKPEMIQGSVSASRAEIEKYFGV